MSRPIAYLHRYFHGAHHRADRIPATFDEADKMAARLARTYGCRGWSYEVSTSRSDPRALRNAAKVSVGEDPELVSYTMGSI